MSVERPHMDDGFESTVGMQCCVSPEYRLVREWCARLMPAAGLNGQKSGGAVNRRTSSCATASSPARQQSGAQKAQAPPLVPCFAVGATTMSAHTIERSNAL